MRIFLQLSKGIIFFPLLKERRKFSAIRCLTDLAVTWKNLPASDVNLAWLLKQGIFGFKNEKPFSAGRFNLLQAILCVASKRLSDDRAEAPTYSELLKFYLEQPYPTIEARWESLRPLNGLLESKYASGPGTMHIPDAAWHIFELLEIFYRTSDVPFAAYADLVLISFALAEKCLERPAMSPKDLPGYQEFLAKVNKRELDLTPQYPQLQNWHLGGH